MPVPSQQQRACERRVHLWAVASCTSLSVTRPGHSSVWRLGHLLQTYTAEALGVRNNPQSHLQHLPVAYNVGCWRGCCGCFRVRAELGKCGNSYCFLNFTLQSDLCAYNVSSVQTGVLLVLRRLCLLVHELGNGLLCLPPSRFSLLPPSPDSFSAVQTGTERRDRAVGACCRVLERGASAAECHLCVPGRRRGVSSFLPLAALTRRRVVADGTCPEILLWRHAREIFAETTVLFWKVALALVSRVLSLLP